MPPVLARGEVQLTATPSKAGLFSKCKVDIGGGVLRISDLR